MASGYDQRLDRGFGTGEALVLVALGVAAGALATWLIAGQNKAQISVANLGQVNPRDWLAKAAQTLQQGRDRMIHGVEERASGDEQS